MVRSRLVVCLEEVEGSNRGQPIIPRATARGSHLGRWDSLRLRRSQVLRVLNKGNAFIGNLEFFLLPFDARWNLAATAEKLLHCLTNKINGNFRAGRELPHMPEEHIFAYSAIHRAF